MDQKISQLTPATSLTGSDVLPIVDNIGTPTTKSVSLTALDARYTSSSAGVSPFVQSKNGQFLLKGERFKFVGINYYPLLFGNTAQSAVRQFFDVAKRKGISVVRAWCFDSPDAFRSLSYPLGTPNSVTNPSFETDTSGWSVGSAFTRSNDTAHQGTWSMKQNSAFNTYDGLIYPATVTAHTDYVWTMWYQINNVGGQSFQLPPVTWVGSGDNIGANQRSIADGGIIFPSSTWTRRQIKFNSGANTTIFLNIINYGGQSTGYWDDMDLSPAQSATLTYNEASLVRLDIALDEARKKGVKLMLSLADGNESNYNTKHTYISWANIVNNSGLADVYPYIAFFSSTDCKNLYKNFISTLASRVNTVNGLTYKNDPTIFSWELGNELRVNYGDANVNTINGTNLTLLAKSGGWADEMSTYIKSVDPNHMVNFGDMGHTWQYTANDVVSNGTYYGVDYAIMSALPNIDFLDFHLYPNQNNGGGFGFGVGGGNVWGWGVRLGYPLVSASNASAAGLRAQLKDYVDVGHANGKPVVMGETGLESQYTPTGDYPLYNRYTYFSNLFKDTFDLADGMDGIIPWSGSPGTTSSSFDIALAAYGGEAKTDNTDDTTIVNLFKKYNDRFQLDILKSQGEFDVKYAPIGSAQILATSGTISVDPSKSFIQQTPTGDSTFNAASVDILGRYLEFEITTSGTTSYTLTFGTSFKSTGTLATGTVSGKIFMIRFMSDGTNYVEISRTTAM